MKSIMPNPGGIIDPDDLVGREQELARLHEAVIHGGAVVTGERRMGKSSVLRKLRTDLTAAGRTVIHVSAETENPDVFADRLAGELRASKVLGKRFRRWEKEVDGSLGFAVGGTGIKLTAKARRAPDEVKELDLVKLLTAAGDHGSVVLIIDEITVLCMALRPRAAVEFLRALRAERQRDRGLPTVLSGSIGLHHAVPDRAPINDLWPVDIGPLNTDRARELATRLLLGIGMPSGQNLVTEIVAHTSRIPYYIHGVVDELRYDPNPSIEDIVDDSIAQNNWDTRHYVTRVPDYYGADAAPVVRTILDQYALDSSGHLELNQLQRQLDVSADSPPDRDSLIDVLDRLVADHYLARDGTTHRMSSPLLAKIWRTHRQLP